MQQIAVFNSRNRDALARVASCPKWQQVVNCREIIGGQRMEDRPANVYVEVRRPGIGGAVIADRAERHGVRSWKEVMQRCDSGNGGCECCRDLRTARVGNVMFATGQYE